MISNLSTVIFLFGNLSNFNDEKIGFILGFFIFPQYTTPKIETRIIELWEYVFSLKFMNLFFIGFITEDHHFRQHFMEYS